MNALRTSVMRSAPAARRALTAAAETSSKGKFKDTWAVPEAAPLVVMVVIPSLFAIYTTARTATTHVECKWSKVTKSQGVCAWYEEKYPGTKAMNRSGAKFADGH